MTKTTTKKTALQINSGGLKVRVRVKAGGLSSINSNRGGLKARVGIKAGGLSSINHNRRSLSAIS